MEDSKQVFHVAIPCRDLDEAEDFYVKKLGCKLGRKYPNRITLNFFGSQLVCHLYPQKIDLVSEIYPRHFGIIFSNKEDFDTISKLAKQQDIEFVKEPTLKRKGEVSEVLTFYLKDPSNNVIQFKLFSNAETLY
ncbi:MAG: glyoxalase [Hapalosiphonaceae cyanobacterium JJU2]|nr:MAG: glyoxalase [Hapalosiphonaceae cyanobacterium JJU2]